MCFIVRRALIGFVTILSRDTDSEEGTDRFLHYPIPRHSTLSRTDKRMMFNEDPLSTITHLSSMSLMHASIYKSLLW